MQKELSEHYQQIYLYKQQQRPALPQKAWPVYYTVGYVFSKSNNLQPGAHHSYLSIKMLSINLNIPNVLKFPF